ncbi:MAG: galactokinase [Solirubrobacteraceae bacterium]
MTVSAEPIDGDRIVAIADDLAESEEFPLHAVTPAPGWRAFVRGAVVELGRAGVPLRGARLTITGAGAGASATAGKLPIGGGLSSSAALSVALCLALLRVAGEDGAGWLDADGRLRLARICSAIENRWVGAQTGLLDQLASLCGRAGHALAIDFRSLVIEPVPLELGGFRLVTVASGAPRALAGDGTGYNDRRDQCRRACQLLGVPSLRDATLADAAGLPDPLDRRVRHVVSENARVRDAIDALRAADLAALGQLLNDSHVSLRDDYEVSVPAVEAAREALLERGALGARIVGGGFGGSVLGLFAPGVEPPAGALEHVPSAGAQIRE